MTSVTFNISSPPPMLKLLSHPWQKLFCSTLDCPGSTESLIGLTLIFCFSISGLAYPQTKLLHCSWLWCTFSKMVEKSFILEPLLLSNFIFPFNNNFGFKNLAYFKKADKISSQVDFFKKEIGKCKRNMQFKCIPFSFIY